jgi:hypothetical protein
VQVRVASCLTTAREGPQKTSSRLLFSEAYGVSQPLNIIIKRGEIAIWRSITTPKSLSCYVNLVKWAKTYLPGLSIL